MATGINSKNGVVKGIGTALLTAMLLSVTTGCGRQETRQSAQAAPAQDGAADLPSELFLADAPGDIVTVQQLKDSAAEGDEAVVRVVVGGRKSPFVAGRAVWTAVDAALPNSCTRTGHACPQPWDYCCTPPDTLAANMLTIRVLDDSGRPLAVNLAQSPTIKPMTTLVVRGTVADSPVAEALMLNATGIYVEDTPET